MVESIGIVGSVLVAISLTMTNVWRLRWINLVGAIFFTVYGLLLRAWPIFGVNAFICVIDVYYIVQMTRGKDVFSTIDVTADSRFLRRFVDFHREDVARFFPAFSLDEVPADGRYVFVLRNMLPVGLFIYGPCQQGEVEIILDYVTPDYRDFENGAFLYSRQEVSRDATSFVARTQVPHHQAYLRRMGFREEAPGVFRRPAA